MNPRVVAAFLAATLLSSCVRAQPSPSPVPECIETPTTSKVVAGYTLWGKGGDVFLVLYRDARLQDPVLRASTFQKMLVVVEHPIIPITDAERIPNELNIPGRNISTGTTQKFVAGRHNSELGIGVEWGTNFEFADPGCWELQLSAPRNAASTVVVKVLQP
jgi:hypothetical protein